MHLTDRDSAEGAAGAASRKRIQGPYIIRNQPTENVNLRKNINNIRMKKNKKLLPQEL
jgi:hypothetical protein